MVEGLFLNFSLSWTNSNWVGDRVLFILEVDLNKIIIFPNPVDKVLFVQGIKAKKTYSIITIDGKEVLEGKIVMEHSITLEHILKGIYL